VKANPRLFLLRFLRERGFFAETVSLGEVFRSYRAGFLPEEVLLNGPVKPPRVLKALSEAGVPFLGVDSPAELERIARTLPGARILLRVNPDLPVSTHPHLATGKGESQFGMLPETIPEAAQRARELGLRLTGLHLHLGSALEAPEDFEAGYRVTFSAQHIHGGIGVDREYPVHRYYVYARHLELVLGGSTHHLRRLGKLIAESATAA